MIKLCLGGERGSEKVSALKVISQQVCEEGGAFLQRSASPDL